MVNSPFFWVSCLALVVNFLLAVGVWNSAAGRDRDQKPVMYVGPAVWALATLVWGVFGLVAYWLIHHSALRKLYNRDGSPAKHD